jgi:hypothetical protein
VTALLALLHVALAARQDSTAARRAGIEPWFPRLESESWIEREEAQRRIAAALEPGDAAQLRAALLAGGAETR